MSLVGLVKIEGGDQIKDAISRSLDLIEYDFDTRIRNIVIKPNLCYYWDYSTGQTTDPNTVGALIDLLRERVSSNVNITIVESDASAMKCKYAFRMLGYERLANEREVEVVNLTEDEVVEESVEVNNETFVFNVPQTIEKADLRINVPKLKYSFAHIKITCALKNIFGCNPNPHKYKYHKLLDKAIVALNKLMKFDLCILDGIIVSGVQTKKLGLLMSGKDPVAFDSVAALIAGVKPMSINYLLLAQKEGLGNALFIPKGVDLRFFMREYPKKKSKDQFMEVGLRAAYAFGLQEKIGLE